MAIVRRPVALRAVRLRRLRALPATCESLLKSFASPATAWAFCISKSMQMGTNLLSKLLTTGLVLALGSVSAAQTGSTVSEGGLRPSWSDSAMAEGWRFSLRRRAECPGRASPECRDQGTGAGQRGPGRQHEGSRPHGRRASGEPRGLLCANARWGDFVQRDCPPRRLGIRGWAVGNSASHNGQDRRYQHD